MNNAIDRIRGAVRGEAETEAARILAEAREQLERMLDEFRRDEEGKALAAVEAERRRLAQESFREISRAQRGARLALLAARNRVIDEIFSRARAEALHLPEGRYREILRRWLVAVDAPGGGEVIPARRDAALVERLVGEVNASRPAAAALVVSAARAPFESGFVVRTAQFEVEWSLDEWMGEQKREMAPRLERELFGEAPDAHAE